MTNSNISKNAVHDFEDLGYVDDVAEAFIGLPADFAGPFGIVVI